MRVFEDEYNIEIYDYLHSLNEERYNVIGSVYSTSKNEFERLNNVLFVVFTMREYDTAESKRELIRIISARLATKVESRLYFENFYNRKKGW